MTKGTVQPTLSDLQGAITNLVLLGPKLLSISLSQAAQFVEQSSELLASSLPNLSPSKRVGCCEIPETHCPPRCVCEICWEACYGERREATVRVTNSSPKQTRTFEFEATPFQGPANPGLSPKVSPASATLKPGESVTVTLEFAPTDAFQSGQTYSAEVLIKGAYEQCVCVRLKVYSCKQGHCEVCQGDPPVRIRAHQWYDHFQCIEPCYPVRSCEQDALKP